jgi:hypothetical protein
MYYYAGLIMQTSGSSLHSGVVTCLGLLQLPFMLIPCCWLPAVTAAAEPLMHVCIGVGIAQPQGRLSLMLLRLVVAHLHTLICLETSLVLQTMIAVCNDGV